MAYLHPKKVIIEKNQKIIGGTKIAKNISGRYTKSFFFKMKKPRVGNKIAKMRGFTLRKIFFSSLKNVKKYRNATNNVQDIGTKLDTWNT